MNALHCGNLPDFHAQHIPGVQAAGLDGRQVRDGFIQPPDLFRVLGLFFLFHQSIFRRGLRPADGGFLNPVIAVKGVKRLVAVHLAISGGLGPLIQQERFDNLIGHFHKGVLGAERVILFQVDDLHRHASLGWVRVIVAAHIPQAPPDGNADLAAVYVLPPGDFRLVDTGDVVGHNAAALCGGGMGKRLRQGGQQAQAGGLFLPLHHDFLRRSAMLQRVVLRPAICVQRVVGAVVELPALIVLHLAPGLLHDLPNLIADLHKLVVPVVGIYPPQIDCFHRLPPENGRGGQLVRCPPPAGIRETIPFTG